MKSYYTYRYPIGTLAVIEENHHITGINLLENTDITNLTYKETSLTKTVNQQLTEYFNKQRTIFDLPLALKGTPFQIKCWEQLQQIPYGQTRSYQDLAIAVGNPKACRAVGGANHNNPILIVIPCHRVIGKNGSLTGFGAGIDVKKYLINLEKNS